MKSSLIGSASILLVMVLTGSSLLMADSIEVQKCQLGSCDTANLTGSLPDPLPAGQSGTDNFAFPSFAPIEIEGQVQASDVVAGTGLGSTLTGGVAFTLEVDDLTGEAATISVIVQQTVASPGATGDITGTSYLQGTMNPAAVADGDSLTAGVQSGGYYIGSFTQGAAATFDDSGSGLIPGYAADGYFYENVTITFNADPTNAEESVDLPLSGSFTVPYQATPTPEPGCLVMLAGGALSLLVARLRN